MSDPLAPAQAKLVQGPQTVLRYNGFRGAVINGAPKPPANSSQTLAAMERISSATLPPGYSREWTGTALQKKDRERPYRDRARWRCTKAGTSPFRPCRR